MQTEKLLYPAQAPKRVLPLPRSQTIRYGQPAPYIRPPSATVSGVSPSLSPVQSPVQSHSPVKQSASTGVNTNAPVKSAPIPIKSSTMRNSSAFVSQRPTSPSTVGGQSNRPVSGRALPVVPNKKSEM